MTVPTIAIGWWRAFAKNNLYENPFSNVLAALAFAGYGSSLRLSLRSSPEFTANGRPPNCWRRVDGKVTLYKGGTMGASNTGYEPYSEYHAAQVAAAMGANAPLWPAPVEGGAVFYL